MRRDELRNDQVAAEIDAFLRQRGFATLTRRYYAATPLASRVARSLGVSQFANNLFVTACRRMGPRPAQENSRLEST